MACGGLKPKTVTISKEADGWYVSFSSAEVPTDRLPLTGRVTGIDVELKVFLITADGDVVENPRQYRKAERELAKANRTSASPAARRAVDAERRPWPSARRNTNMSAGSAQTFTTRRH